MSVIGIDMGYQTCYVAVARQGGIESIANECSDRCTPNCISMGEKNRYLGTAAKNQVITNYKNTVYGWKQLIGRKFKDPIVERAAQMMSADVIEGHNGSIGIQVSYLGEKHVFSPEQVMAMMLTKLKEISEVALKTKVVDCVINVPCYYTDIQRRAMLDAASLVGLNVLRLMNDTAATALNYGIYKQDLPAPEEKPRNVVFVDMGHSDTQLALCAFNKGKLTVLSTAYDPDLGGITFDRLIADHFCEDFKTRYRLDVKSSPKVYARLLQESERLKKLMSGTAQDIPLNIECFMNDKDVSGAMGRATLEKLAEAHLKKVEMLMRSVLESAKLKPDDIYSVEVVGGSSRIPAVKDLVRVVYGKEASMTLNADEAVARGCALQCAIQSPSFRVRDFTVLDALPYPIELSWKGGIIEEEGSNCMTVCNQYHIFPFLKQLTFYRKDKFELDAHYLSPDIPTANSAIGSFVIDKVVPQLNGDSSKVKVKVRVNMHGIFSISGASMTEKIETVDEPMEVENPADKNGTETTNVDSSPVDEKNSEKRNAEEEEEKKDALDDVKVPTENGPAGKQNQQNDNGDKKTPNEQSKKQKVKVIDLPIIPRVPAMTKKEINTLMEKEGQMIMQDKLEKERVDAKNAVEEYVYDMRKKICGDMEVFMLEVDRNEFLRQLEETENWLYEDGEDLLKQAYIDRLDSLKAVGNPVVERYREHMERPAAFEQLGQTIQLLSKILDAYYNKDEKYEHIDAAEMEKVKKAVLEKQTWFEKNCNLLNQHSPHLPPPVTTTQIKAQRETLQSTCNPIVNRPKPKPPKVEPPKEENKTTNGAEDATASKPTEDSKQEGQENGPRAEESNGSRVDMDLD